MKKTNRLSRLLAMLLALAMLVNSQGMTSMAAVIGGVTGSKKQTEAPQTETEPATEAVAQTEAQEPESVAETELASEAQGETELESELETEIESESESEGLTAAEMFEEETESESESETELPEFAEPQTYTYEDGKVTIEVTVPEGVKLPYGAEIRVEPVPEDSKEYAEAVEAVEAANPDVVFNEHVFYDIYFVTKEGVEVEPVGGEVSVQMRFNDPLKTEVEDVSGDQVAVVSHIQDNGELEDVTDEVSLNRKDEVKAVEFSTDSFTIYGVGAGVENNYETSDTIPSYSLKYLLEGYNAVAIQNPEAKTPEEKGGNVSINEHTMGGILAQGNLTGTSLKGYADSPLVNPSYIAGKIEDCNGGLAGGKLNGRHEYDWKPLYVGTINTLTDPCQVPEGEEGSNGGRYLNGHNSNYNLIGRDGMTDNSGPIYKTDNYVNWSTLRNAVISGMGYLNEGLETKTVPQKKNGDYSTGQKGTPYKVELGSTVSLALGDKNSDSESFYIDVTGTSSVHSTKTVINIVDEGYVRVPAIASVNGVELKTEEGNALGMSIVFTFPKATKVQLPNDPIFGHVIAPYADITTGGGNYSGCLIGKNVTLNGEGHMWPYTGDTLIPDQEGFHALKHVNGKEPKSEENKKFTFYLDELKGKEWVNIDSATNDGSKIAFKDQKYGKNSEGDHWYLIREDQKLISGYTISRDLYVVKVHVEHKVSIEKGVRTEAYFVTEKKYYKVEDAKKLIGEDGSINEELLGKSISEDEVVFNNTTEEEKGSLKIKKNVTINSNPTEGTLADGKYTFKVAGPNGYEKSITIQIDNGESSWVQLDNLTPGEYTVTEVLDKESNIEVTTPSSGIWTGTVTAGNTTKVPTAEFTNNVKIDGTFALKGIKTIDTTESPVAGETFTFTLKKRDGGKWTEVRSTTNAGGAITFSDLKLENLWTEPDAWYLIEEQVGDGNFIYATDQYIAHVEVESHVSYLPPLYILPYKWWYETKITYYKVKKGIDANKESVFDWRGNIDSSKANKLDSWENVAFNNDRLGELSVTKAVSGTAPESDASYEVTVKPAEGQTGIDMSGVKVKKGDRDITSEATVVANSVKFSFKAGETVTLSKLPKGKYVVEETSSGKFIKEYTVGGSTDKQNDPVTVEIKKGATSASVTVTNTYPTDAKMSLKANKTLTNGTLGDDDYSFTLKLTGDSTGLVVKDAEGKDLTDVLKSAGIVCGNNASGEILFDGFTFSKEGMYTFTLSENIPESEDDGIEYDAAEYTITVEVELDKSTTPYQYKVADVTATKKADKSDAESAVTDAIITVEGGVYTINSDDTFVNRVKKGKLSVTKEVLGNTADDETIYTVHVTGSLTKEQWNEVLEYNEGLQLLYSKENHEEVIGLQFSIRKDETVTIDKLPIGVYHVEEFIEGEVAYEASYAVDEDETRKIEGINVNVPDEEEADGHTVEITNTYPNEVSVAFGGKKHVKVKGTGVDENTVYPNATFTFELYNAVETEDGEYTVSGDALQSVDVTMPLENGEDGSFVFDEASLEEAVKGALTYKKADTYYYIVKETVTETEKGFTYDGTTYVIKVEVTKSEDGKNLEAAASIVSPAGKALNRAEDGVFYGLDFTNTYTYGDLVVEKVVSASKGVADPNKEYTIYVTNTAGKDLSGAKVAIADADGEFGEAQAVTTAQLTSDKAGIILTLKGSQKAKITQLPLGYYHVEEVILTNETGDYSATYEGGIEVADKKGVNVELEQGEGKTTSDSVTVTNTYPNQGELRVHKKVTGTWLPDADTTEYTIEISRKDRAAMTGAEVYKAEGETKADNALAADGLKITVKLKAGEEIVVRNLAPGDYVVKETTQDEAFTTQVTVTTTPNIGENTLKTEPGAEVEFYFGYKDTVSVEIQNDYNNKGALEIKKTVDGTTAPSDDTWYEITVEGPAGAFTAENVGEASEKYIPGVLSDDGSKVTFKLRKDGSVRFENLPAGDYAVTEAGSGFTKKFTVDPATEGSESATVNLSGEKTEGTVTVNNHYPNKTSMELKGTKAVVGKKLEDQKYSFYINLESTVPEGNKDGATLEHEEEIYNNDTEIDFGSITFTKNGEYTFKIGENTSDDKDVNKDSIIYTVTVKVDEVNGDYLITKVEITNSESGVSKTYDKNAEGGEWPADGELFELPEYEKDGARASFINDVKTGTLHVSKTVIEGNVAVDPNATYTVNVTADVDWSHVTVDGAESTDITETKEDKEDVVVGKSFKIKGGATVTLNNLPVGTYTVTEESDTGYVASYVVSKDGKTTEDESNENVVLGYQDEKTVAITNTYPKNVSMSLRGTKQVEDGLLGTYSFKLIKVDGPDGVAIDAADADGSLTVQNAGETFTFNGITFSAAGTYTFEVSEVEDKDNSGIEYDKTKYRVTVKVAKTADGTTYEITEAKIETIKTVKADEEGSETTQVIVTEVYGTGEGEKALPENNAFTLPDKTFTNREKRGTLKVEKIVVGDSATIAAHTSDEYTVRVTNDKINWGDELIEIKSSVGDEKATTDLIGANAAGKENAVIGKEFTIAKGEIVTFSGLPIGEYTVEEILPTGETAALYTATVEGVRVEDAEPTEDVVGGTVTVEDGGTANVTVTNTYPTKASVDFGGTKTLEVIGGTMAPQATFTFELYETDDKYSLDGAKKIDSAFIDDLATAGSEEFNFKSIDYTDVGTHYYVIKETVTVTDGDGGFTNDTRLHKIMVVVTKDKETNKLVATKTDVDNTNFNFTNTYIYGSLSVQKVVLGRAPEGEEYSVTVSSTKNFAKAKVQINSGEPTSLTEKDAMYSYTFTLGANDVAKFTELPVGSYTVTEETPEGVNYAATYNVTGGDEESGIDSTGATVKLTPTVKEGSVTITNTYTNKGELSIVKTTDGSWAPTSETYTITVTGGPKGADLSSDEIEVFFGDTKVEDSRVVKSKDSIVLQMPKDVTVKISGLMPGDYTVTEKLPENANYAATYSVKVNGEVAMDAKGDVKDRTDAPKVEIENNKSTSVEVKNTYPEIGELKITKLVKGETKDLYTTDVYEIAVAGTAGEDMSGAVVDGEIAGSLSVSDDGKTITFKMNANDTVTITGLKKGNYTVTETSEGNYVASYTYTADGSAVDSIAGIPLGPVASQEVTVTNTYPDELHLTIDGDKKLVGRDLEDGEFTFKLRDLSALEKATLTDADEEGALTTGNNVETGMFKFEGITFRKEGTYTFEISEVIGTDEDVTYDRVVYTVTVVVVKDEDTNQYKVESVTVTAADEAGNVTVSEPKFEGKGNNWAVTLPKHTGADNTATFVNEIKKGSLIIKKTSIDGYAEDIFTFHVTLNGTPYDGKAKLNDGTELLIENGVLKLQDGQTATIDGILYGTAYVVTENKDGAYTPEQQEFRGTISATTPTISVEYVNTYETNDVDFQPEVTKTVNGRLAPKVDGETYTFELTVVKKDAKGNIVEGGWTETKELTLKSVDAEGILRAFAQFEKHTFRKADRGYTYVYTITEVIPKKAKENGNVLDGVTYDDTVYTYEVTIVDDTKGHLTAEVVKKTTRNGVEVIDGNKQIVTDDATGTVTAVFVNEYEATGLGKVSGTKTLTGRQLDDRMFTFQVKNAKGDVVGEAQNVGGSFTIENIGKEQAEDGTVLPFTLEDVGKDLSGYKLVELIPTDAKDNTKDGVRYTTKDYELNVSVSDDGDGSLTVSVTVVDGSAFFQNTYNTEETIGLDATKKLIGRKLGNGEFTFVLAAVDDVNEGTVQNPTVKNDADGKIDFGKEAIKITLSDMDDVYPTVDEKGESISTKYFEYTLTEQPTDNVEGSESTVTNDPVPVRTLTLKATYNWTTGVLTLAWEDDADEQVFVNNYDIRKKTGVQLTKELSGLNLTKGAFQFKLEKLIGGKVGDKFTSWKTIATATNDSEGNASFKDAIVVELKDLPEGEFDYETGQPTYPDQTYTYRVSEVRPADADEAMIYDETVYTFTVTTHYDYASGTLTLTNDAPGDGYTFKNEWTAKSSVPLTGIKKQEDLELKAGRYSFEVYNAADVLGRTADGMPLLVNGAKPVLGPVTNAADGSITFGSLSYDLDDMKNADGTYAERKEFEYKVLEVKGTDEGITYDPAVKTVTVVVTYDMTSGVMHADLVQNEEGLVFTNKYDTEETIGLNAKKEMVGRDLTQEDLDTYTFTLAAADPAYAHTVQTKDPQKLKMVGEDAVVDFGEAAIKIELDDMTGMRATDVEGEYKKEFQYTLTENGNRPHVTNADAQTLTLIAIYNENSGSLTLAWQNAPADVKFTNTYAATGLGELEGKKFLEGRKIKDGEFTFQVKNANSEVVGEATNIGSSFKITGIGKALDADGKVLPFTQDDVGKEITGFTLTEDKGSDSKIVKYDSKSYPLTITVSIGDDSELKVEVDGGPDVKFENKYDTSYEVTLQAKKEMLGRALNADDVAGYTFTLTEDVPEDTEGSEFKSTVLADNSTDGLELTEDGGAIIDFNNQPVVRITLADMDDADKSGSDGIWRKDFHYTLTETGTRPGVTNDPNAKKLTLHAAYNYNTGVLSATWEEGLDDLTFRNTYEATGSFSFEGKKVLEGRDLEDDNRKFRFSVVETKDGMPTGKSWIVRNNGGTIDFGPFAYTLNKDQDDTGIYVYRIREIVGETDKGYTYDDSVYEVTAEVEDNKEGKLIATKKSVTKNGEAVADQTVTFTNKYEATGSITFDGVKTLEGKDLNDERFQFSYVEMKQTSGGNTLTGASGIVRNDDKGKVSFGPFTYTKNKDADGTGTYVYRIREIVGDLDGDYTYDNTYYDVTVVVTDNGDGTLKTQKTRVTQNGTEDVTAVAFENEYDVQAQTGLDATKVLVGRKLKKGEFAFTLQEEKGSEGTLDISKAMAVNDEDGNIVFADDTITIELADMKGMQPTGVENEYAKDFTYTLSEAPTSNKSVTSDLRRERMLTLRATYNKKTGSLTLAWLNELPDLTFTNTYDTQEKTGVELTKELTGLDLAMHPFTFDLEKKTGENEWTRIISKINDAKGRVSFANAITIRLADMLNEDGVTYAEDKTFTYRVKESIPEKPNADMDYDDHSYEFTVDAHYDFASGKLTLTKHEPENGKTFTNTWFAEAAVPLTGSKTLEDKKLEAGKYSFAVYHADDVEVVNGKETVKAGAKPVLGPVANEENGSITFGSLTYYLDDIVNADGSYPAEKTFNYKVVELAGNEQGVSYDESVKNVIVKVTYNRVTGKMNATLESGTDRLIFVNDYDTDETIGLHASKVIDGRELTAKDEGKFTFTLAAVDPAYAKTVTKATATNGANGVIDFGNAAVTIELDDMTGMQPTGTEGEYTKQFAYTLTESPKAEDAEDDGVTNNTTPKNLTLIATYNEISGLLTLAWAEGSDNQTFINTYEATGKLSLEAQKLMADGTTPVPEIFWFTAEAVSAVKADGTEVELEGPTKTKVHNDADGKVSFPNFVEYSLADVGTTFTYTVTEDIPADRGIYLYDETVYTVTVTLEDNGDGTLSVHKTITKDDGTEITEPMQFVNDVTDVKLDKVNEAGDKVVGAKLQIKDAESKVVDEWTTTEEIHELTGKLEAGKTYTLEEVEAPVGYGTAKAVEFTVTLDGKITVDGKEVTLVTMVDKHIHFNVNKTDITNDEEVEGAQLEVLDKDGKVVDSWTSKKGETHDFGSKLKAGENYTLREEVAPDGYAYVTDIEFTVEKDGTITTDMKKTTDEAGNETYLVEDAPLHFNVNKTDLTNDEEVEGAQLEVLDKDGNVVDSWTSKKGETHDFGSKLKAGESYTLREEVAPDGYAYVTDIEFKVEKDGTITTDMKKTTDEDGNETYLVEDKPLHFNVNKTDITNDEEVEGAQLEVLDKDGKVVDSWTSKKGETHDFGAKLKAGESYTLREEVAPDGYAYVTDIEFTVEKDGTITTDMKKTTDEEGNETYLVEDAPLHFNVNKTDITNDEEVEGAQLEVLDKDGKVVDSWTSKKGETHDFGSKLKAGESYTLREEVAPDGYAYVTDIEFTVEKDGTITTDMKKTTDEDGNETYLVEDKPLHFNVNKTDITNDEEVEGAQLEVLDKDGKVVDSWTSKKGETYDFGSKLKAGESYTLREEVAPDGYAYVTDIEFKVEKDGTITTDMKKTTDEDGNDTYLVEDAPIVGAVTLKKHGPDGEELAGAAFQLYYKTDETESGWALYNSASYVTGIDGTLTVSGLKANEYYFVETEAPAGYVIETDENGEPVKYPFTIALDEADKTNAEVSVELDVTNAPDAKDTTLVVTKQLVSQNDELWNAVDATFYVALFEDEELTKQVSEVQPIVFENSNTSSTTFENLEIGKTYYVAETNADGVVLNGFGGALATGEMFDVDFYDDNVVTMTRGDGTKVVYFRNVFREIPEDFYREGQLTVTKQLLGADGTAKKSNKTFYAGIFDDAAFTKLSGKVSQNIVELAMNGTSSASNTVKVTVSEEGKTTVYVTEVDKNGNPVAGAASFKYDVTVDGSTVTMDLENLSAAVTITNQEREKESEEESEVFTEGSTEEEEGTVPSSTKAVKTGDETPIPLYVGLLLAAALLLILAFVLKRRKKS